MSKKRVQAWIFSPLDEAAINSQLSGISTKEETVIRTPEDKNDIPEVVVNEYTWVDVWFEVDSEAVTFNSWLRDTHCADGHGRIYVCGNDESPPVPASIDPSDEWEVSPSPSP